MKLKMKCVLSVFVILYLFYRTVHGAKSKEVVRLEIDPLEYDEDNDYIRAGSAVKLYCRGSTKNQKVDWYDPSDQVVKRRPADRIHVQDNVILSPKAAASALSPAKTLALSVNHAAVADSGVWQCKSGHLKRNVSLCVLDPAEFVNTVTEVTVDLGRAITLFCKATGEPEPTFQWERNGQVITEDDNSTKYKAITVYTSQELAGLLTVTSLQPSDSGVYTCVTKQQNSLVDDECSHTESLNITLNINYGPIFSNGNDNPHHYYANDNEIVDLTCAVEAFPPPTFKWFHQIGEVLSELPEKSFIVTQDGTATMLSLTANSSTFGETYTCRATNPYGDVYKQLMILILEKPLKPSEVFVSSFTDTTIALNYTWDEEVLLPPPVDTVEVQYFQKTASGAPKAYHWRRAKNAEFSSGSDIKLTGLKEETEYWMRLRASNSAGESGWSTLLLISTGPKSEEKKAELTEEDDEAGDKVVSKDSDNMIYGILFAAGVFVVAIVFTYFINK